MWNSFQIGVPVPYSFLSVFWWSIHLYPDRKDQDCLNRKHPLLPTSLTTCQLFARVNTKLQEDSMVDAISKKDMRTRVTLGRGKVWRAVDARRPEFVALVDAIRR